MKTELKKLDNNLQEKRPAYYKDLQKPLSEQEIADLEAKYNISLSADIKELYLWKNGQNGGCRKSFVYGYGFLPLEDVFYSNKEITEDTEDFDEKNWWNENWLPVFDSMSEDYICYDTKGVFTGKEGQLLWFFHNDGDRSVIAPSLRDFLSGLNQYYEKKPVSFFEDEGDYIDISEEISHWKKEFTAE